MEPREVGVMPRPPRAPGKPFLPRWTVPIIVVPSVLLALVTLVAFVVALDRAAADVATAQSAAFTTLVLAHLGTGWAQLTTFGPSLRLSPRSNPTMLAALVVGLAFVLMALYTEPGQVLFGGRPLDLGAWALTLGLTPAPLLSVEIVQMLQRSGRR
jgi:cation-transporting P-type ATPase F